MKIGEAAKASGVSVGLIRYYESIGLVPKMARIASGSRGYTETVVELLRFIRRAQELAFSMDQIRRLVVPWHLRRRSGAAITWAARECVADLHARMANVQATSNALEDLARHRCRSGSEICRIAKKLASDLNEEMTVLQAMRDVLATFARERGGSSHHSRCAGYAGLELHAE